MAVILQSLVLCTSVKGGAVERWDVERTDLKIGLYLYIINASMLCAIVNPVAGPSVI